MIERKGNFVFKTGDQYTEEWRKKLSSILKVIRLPAFVSFTYTGYITQYIDGIDLQEDKPFNYRHDIVRALPLNDLQKSRVVNIFKDVIYAGIQTGYTLADFTKRNIILEGNKPYLIDYDVIIEGDLSQDYIDIFQRMIDYLGIPYKFDGDLKKLYECFD